VKLSFSAPFFGSFFGRAKNEQRKVVLREQSEKYEPQNYLQPCPDSYREGDGRQATGDGGRRGELGIRNYELGKYNLKMEKFEAKLRP
jgi:hypothetical protein